MRFDRDSEKLHLSGAGVGVTCRALICGDDEFLQSAVVSIPESIGHLVAPTYHCEGKGYIRLGWWR
jgi:hypothetical protein